MATHIAIPREAMASLEAKGAPTEKGPQVAEELAKIPHEPFLRVETQLVGWSLILGLILLGGLIWVSNTFFAG